MKVYLATANENKLKEINVLLEKEKIEGVTFELIPTGIPEPEETGDTFEKNAYIKAKYYAKILKAPCLADDSGLEVSRLDGMPGVHSKRWVGKENPTVQELCDHLRDELTKKGYESSYARYVCAMNLFIPSEASIYLISTGYLEGFIKKKMKGTHGFGYDPIFYIDENTTVAELSEEQKNEISHRGKALRIIIAKLKELLNLCVTELQEHPIA